MKYLDIAGGEAPHCLVESLEHPDGFYVCVDTRPSRYSPEVWYWKSKEFLLRDSQRQHGASVKEGGVFGAIDDIVIASWLIDVPSSDREGFLQGVGGIRNPEYYNLSPLLKKLKAYPEGGRVLASKVSEFLYDDEKIVYVFNDRFPKLVGEPRDEETVFHSGLYAWNRIEQILLGEYSDSTVEEILGVGLAPETKRRLQDACSHIHFVQGSMYDLPFREKSFDYVRGSGIPDIQAEKPMSEARRVLKNGKVAKVGPSGIDTQCE
jgi:hypothetical protein